MLVIASFSFLSPLFSQSVHPSPVKESDSSALIRGVLELLAAPPGPQPSRSLLWVRVRKAVSQAPSEGLSPNLHFTKAPGDSCARSCLRNC